MRLRPGIFLFALLAAPLLAPQPIAAQMSLQQTLELRKPGPPALSPDGKLVAYAVTHARLATDDYQAILQVTRVDTGESRELATADRITAVQWAPDGTSVVYLAKKEGYYYAWLAPLGGGKSRLLSRNKIVEGFRDDYVDSGAFQISPDGKQALYITRDGAAARRELQKINDGFLLYHGEGAFTVNGL